MRTMMVCLSVFAAICFGATAEEKISHLDISEGDSGGHWVMFFSKGMAPKAPMGTIGAAVGTGDAFEGAFGMFVQSSKPIAGAITESTISDIRDSDKEPPTTITIVDVTADQHASMKKAVEDYSAREKHEDTTVNVLLNFTYDILKVTPMKKPFRSGLGAPNPVTYFEDIALLNRKLAK